MFYSMLKHPKKGYPYLTQDGGDREEGADQYIANFCDGAVAVYKYFDLTPTKEIGVTLKGNGQGTILVKAGEAGPELARISVKAEKTEKSFFAPMKEISGKQPLYLTFEGKGSFRLISFELK